MEDSRRVKKGGDQWKAENSGRKVEGVGLSNPKDDDKRRIEKGVG
jgi:hypothetical protein